MIPEREREALMRLTMCAREECRMCMYQKRCDFNFQCELATKNMNILAEALRKTEPTISKMEQVDEPQYDAVEVAKDINRRGEMGKKEWDARHIEDEPQTEPKWTCARCGCENHADFKWCFRCGFHKPERSE